MMYAYDSLYIEKAQVALGDMLHYAVYDLNEPLKGFYRAFIISGLAYRFGVGEPKYTVGMSGAEIACEVILRTRNKYVYAEPSYAPDRSPQYWAGWALAYYEWCRKVPFERIDEVVPIEEIVDMYSPYHEADVTRFVDEIDRRMQARREASRLARLRAYAELTQRALAERSGVSVRMIEQYEQGKKDINNASAATVHKLAGALHCRMEDLLNPVIYDKF